MLIAHEAPLSIMPQIQALTDYDYCLVHLLEQSEGYLNYFLEAPKKGRKIIMDCSLFELGSSFDPAKYYEWLLKIQPDEYIVPDVWQDSTANMLSFYEFESNFDLKALKGIKIGVLQGKTYNDFEKVYKFMVKKADKIAFSFGYDYYLEHFLEKEPPFNTKASAFSRGRFFLISELLKRNVINKLKPHHLLGCGSPLEFSLYKDNPVFSFINSIDTSHPVTSGFFDKDYEQNETLSEKIDTKMVDFFDEEVSPEKLNLILKNVRIFRDNIR